jgi:hypothetical protein
VSGWKEYHRDDGNQRLTETRYTSKLGLLERQHLTNASRASTCRLADELCAMGGISAVTQKRITLIPPALGRGIAGGV